MQLILKFKFEVEGSVSKECIIGTVFGQTEGLFGPELDLSELNSKEQVGWIEVETKIVNNKTYGTLILPLKVDHKVAAIIAASIEMIRGAGLGFPVKFTLEKIEDVNAEVRKQVVARAKEILKEWNLTNQPPSIE